MHRINVFVVWLRFLCCSSLIQSRFNIVVGAPRLGHLLNVHEKGRDRQFSIPTPLRCRCYLSVDFAAVQHIFVGLTESLLIGDDIFASLRFLHVSLGPMIKIEYFIIFWIECGPCEWNGLNKPGLWDLCKPTLKKTRKKCTKWLFNFFHSDITRRPVFFLWRRASSLLVIISIKQQVLFT